MPRPLLALSAMVAAGVITTGATAVPAYSQTDAVRGGISVRDTAISQAKANVTRHADTFGFGAGQRLHVKDVVIDADGTQHVRFERTYHGLPVVGGDFVVHQKADGSLKGSSRAKAHKVALKSLTPAVDARGTAARALKRSHGLVRNARTTPELIVWAADGTPRLAWRTTVQGLGDKGQPHGEVFVTDAATGAAIENYDVEHEATGTGHSEYTGDVGIDTTQQADGTFALIDPVRGHITKDAHNIASSSLKSTSGTLFTDADNIWGDGRKFSADRATAAVDAHVNTAETFDYYKSTFGRNGIKNDGRGATVFVHVGTNWDNAQWSDACFCMMTGDGDGTTDPEQVDLDTMGHEMTHGVTSATANLRYSGESGGLNEATSDILGTMVEWYANNPVDTPDYLFSDQSTPPWLRRFDKPSLDGRSADYWSKSVGRLDVHNSSGVGNHWFYLASEGSGTKTINGITYNSPTYNGSTVTGIGNKKASAIWYRALTVYMTSTTDYKGARTATLNAAKDLYGATSPEYATVAAAWSAVNVG
ncbi:MULTISPECIES: M4 family metallopeptidase [unclassified Streptomyces]|uniref:M4 family metallopeptidase n=1 Tax=unclassified Streptomyces TaxID=2593676 RepID=UPI0011A7F440|nr:M4 family metallopeptidase [Streptomyces sp. BK340]TVZ96190.1 Zn-dependent metalloprotease [Streptomyces sp. BK340]